MLILYNDLCAVLPYYPYNISFSLYVSLQEVQYALHVQMAHTRPHQVYQIISRL